MIFKHIDNFISDTTDSVLSKKTKKFTDEEKLMIDNFCISILKSYKNSQIESSNLIKERFSKDLTYETIEKMLMLNGNSIPLKFKKFYSDQHKDHREAMYETNIEPDDTKSGEFKSKVVTGILVSSWPGYLLFCKCQMSSDDRYMCEDNKHDEVHMRTLYNKNDKLTSSCLNRIVKIHFKNIKDTIDKECK